MDEVREVIWRTVLRVDDHVELDSWLDVIGRGDRPFSIHAFLAGHLDVLAADRSRSVGRVEVIWSCAATSGDREKAWTWMIVLYDAGRLESLTSGVPGSCLVGLRNLLRLA